MAQMIPSDISHLPVSITTGEKALYRIIKRHTPDNWICYVGQRLGCGTTPDFLIIGPDLGVLVLEEKSIQLNSIKKFTTETLTIVEDGASHEITHPLRQARGYIEKAAQLMQKIKRLTDKKGRLKFVYNHGVVLSSIEKDEIEQGTLTFPTPPMATFEPNKVICKNDLPSKYKEKSNFEVKLKRMTNLFKFSPLDENDIQAIRVALFPEVRARVFADELTDRNAIIESLTVEQEQLARGIGKNDKVPHRQLNGVAGCGKSIILRTRAKEIANNYPSWKILITFFTRSLKNYLGADMPPNIDIMTIGQSIYKQWIKSDLDIEIFDVQSEEGWEKMVKILIANESCEGIYDAIFLDESQDLRSSQAEYLRHILSKNSNSAFFCGDIAQNIFRKKSFNWIDYGFEFKGRTSNASLSCNFRNTREIFEFAWEFIEKDFSNNGENNKSFDSYNLYKNIDLKRRGPKPILKTYNSDNEEQVFICKEIHRLVQDERVSPNKIAILHPYATSKNTVMIEPYIRQLDIYGIPTYWVSKDNVSKINYDPRGSYLALSTPDSGKGLEWDIVFMPSLEKYNKENPNSLKFVAAMRARHLLHPSECKKNYVF